MIKIEVSGIAALTKLAENLEIKLSPFALESKTLLIAQQAGVILKRLSVQACVEAIYDMPEAPQVYQAGYFTHGGTPDTERTGALLDAHILVNEGLQQTVQIDENYPVPSNDHSGREMVIDYAIPVHEGYTQFVPDGHGGSKDTGVFHPGRFWFKVAAIDGAPVILEFITLAYFEMVERALAQVA